MILYQSKDKNYQDVSVTEEQKEALFNNPETVYLKDQNFTYLFLPKTVFENIMNGPKEYTKFLGSKVFLYYFEKEKKDVIYRYVKIVPVFQISRENAVSIHNNKICEKISDTSEGPVYMASLEQFNEIIEEQFPVDTPNVHFTLAMFKTVKDDIKYYVVKPYIFHPCRPSFLPKNLSEPIQILVYHPSFDSFRSSSKTEKIVIDTNVYILDTRT